MSHHAVQDIRICKADADQIFEATDKVAVEEPLEISLSYQTEQGQVRQNISVTMRTPGNDDELAAGFLFTEGIISHAAAIKNISQQQKDNQVLVMLHEGIVPNLGKADRNFYTTSSCGVCGKSSIDAIRTVSVFTSLPDAISINKAVLFDLQNNIQKSQHIFEDTGGIHASAFFSTSGQLILLREDVGRHNALDKMIGASLLNGTLPLSSGILFLSGRASFELVQKAVMAGIRVIAAVGAPSSLAVELATEYDLTLIGFLRHNRFNVYCGKQRINW